MARSLVNKALTLKELGRDDDVVATYERLDAEFGDDESAPVVGLVSRGLLNRALALDRLGRHEEEIQVYDVLANRYGGSTIPKHAGGPHTLYNKAITLQSNLDRPDEAITVYDELDTRYGVSDEPPEVTRYAAAGLVRKGFALDLLGRYEDEIQLYDEVVAEFRATGPIRRQFVRW